MMHFKHKLLLIWKIFKQSLTMLIIKFHQLNLHYNKLMLQLNKIIQSLKIEMLNLLFQLQDKKVQMKVMLTIKQHILKEFLNTNLSQMHLILLFQNYRPMLNNLQKAMKPYYLSYQKLENQTQLLHQQLLQLHLIKMLQLMS